ncbi:hypothetical protein [Helicobacter sp. 16-1353]|uniref:hypothetical protein n=1 Tax=Helicobacter sp. 16-1353 TaxID=2004996 RepID=UPI0015EEE8EB|nr:hypothetical protein [Helicobacter sp. 16-1353]
MWGGKPSIEINLPELDEVIIQDHCDDYKNESLGEFLTRRGVFDEFKKLMG